MKYKVGDTVKLKSKEGLDELKRQVGDLHIHPDAYKNAGSEQTILECYEDLYRYDDSSVFWHESFFEGLVEEEMSLDKAGQITDFEYEGLAYTLPDGYQFKDENGNVINATKIVLEKKKKEYPKTYKEAFDMLGYRCDHIMITNPPKDASQITIQEQRFMLLTIQFQKLLTCRDAYWKIAGEEMGLGKPWKPEFGGECYYHISVFNYKVDAKRGLHGLTNCTRNTILAFPTEEMRDAFYENFKELIEQCKELL